MLARFVLHSGMASIIVEWSNRVVPPHGVPRADRVATAARVGCDRARKAAAPCRCYGRGTPQPAKTSRFPARARKPGMGHREHA